MAARVFLALGSNLGHSRRLLQWAVERVERLQGTRVVAQSALYRTAPVGGPDQGDFLNQVIEVETSLAPRALLHALQELERLGGRVHTVRWGPRTLDIDVVWYDGRVVSEPDLEIPHPRLEERRFVLEPLSELAPDLPLPSGRTVRRALEAVAEQRVEKLADGGAMAAGNGFAELQAELRDLARAKNAVVLAHNYQRPEVQDAAHFVGDSLGLSQQAAQSDAELILFCGVDFMAETAAILAPQKKVILPEIRASCPMAQMVDAEGLQALKDEHPGAWVVSYVNTTAAVKALSDVCCTSANAVRVLRAVPADREIIFTPDRNLGSWAARQAGREVILWQGFCPTHELIQLQDILSARQEHPQAKVVVHPECAPEVSAAADAVESTAGMIRFCREDPSREFIIGTEAGMIHRLTLDVPGKTFFLATRSAVCPNMKLTTLKKAVEALRQEQPVITVPGAVREKALLAVQRMLDFGR